MPQFTFEPVDPDNDNRLRVRLKDTGEALGSAWLTKGAGWVAEHAGLTGTQGAVHGFKTEHLAAEFMYWFKPPEQSDRTNPTDRPRPLNPELLPKHGVLISLMPINGGDFLVDCNTRGAGSGIGYLQQRDDGRFDVREGPTSIGIAEKPETGMWACLGAWTGGKFFARLVKGFTTHPKHDPWVNGVITFRGETVEAAAEGIREVAEAVIEGHTEYEASETTYDVKLTPTE
ncbi:hypothetical protein O1L44_30245 [Streptomyces noursei]|uniref:hypothetical protein n=1 Tax=Streptomyces noursei TaxID=1971 RepID=UPI00081C7089|nr:hypothetical protein SNOUR_00115 [Streptomyces noursei ATCC 11455]ANZ21989.1 hypothetical protein SNOUR_43835 [Streptomyces noursei ATCC 11455]MCZ0996429.1 hypothetical protein [Streptomyces noursei]